MQCVDKAMLTLYVYKISKIIIVFHQEQLNKINKFINEQELETAINSLNSNAVPKLEGLPTDFHKTFKKILL